MKRLAWLGLVLAVGGCAMPQVYVTSLGPLRISADSDMTIFDADARLASETLAPLPTEGGLVVRTLNGRPVPFEARDAALEALQAHCLEYDLDTAPLYFGWRDVDGQGHWSAAGCDLR